jgi:hypothetical protein
MLLVGKTAARQAGIRPSMMRSGAVALWRADKRVTKAFDQTIDPVSFVFNRGTENETTVMAHIIVTTVKRTLCHVIYPPYHIALEGHE